MNDYATRTNGRSSHLRMLQPGLLVGGVGDKQQANRGSTRPHTTTHNMLKEGSGVLACPQLLRLWEQNVWNQRRSYGENSRHPLLAAPYSARTCTDTTTTRTAEHTRHTLQVLHPGTLSRQLEAGGTHAQCQMHRSQKQSFGIKVVLTYIQSELRYVVLTDHGASRTRAPSCACLLAEQTVGSDLCMSILIALSLAVGQIGLGRQSKSSHPTCCCAPPRSCKRGREGIAAGPTWRDRCDGAAQERACRARTAASCRMGCRRGCHGQA